MNADVHEPLRDTFRAMNTQVTVALAMERGSHAAAAFQEVRSWLAYAEGVFSRFRPDSELSALNAASGMPVRISRTMEEVLELARRYQRWTEGMFDPGILPELQQAGYAVSFERLRELPPNPNVEVPMTGKPTREWQLLGRLRSVRLARGTQLDLGGIVKGWAVDRMADHLAAETPISAGLLNAGGDLRVWGDADTPAWEIEIADSRQPQATLGTVSLCTGAVATSSMLGRRWVDRAGVARHHLIDPRTGQPADSDIVQCTVAGRSTAECEIVAKTLCLLGSRDGEIWLNRASPACDILTVSREGQVRLRQTASHAISWQVKGASIC